MVAATAIADWEMSVCGCWKCADSLADAGDGCPLSNMNLVRKFICTPRRSHGN
jgi:hypothetical protein